MSRLPGTQPVAGGQLRSTKEMKTILHLIVFFSVSICSGDNGAKLKEHELEYFRAFRENFEKKRKVDEKRFLDGFEEILLPEAIKLTERLEKTDYFSPRTKDWHPVFFDRNVEMIAWNDEYIVFVLFKFVNKAKIIRYYYDPEDAPKEESRPEDGYRPSSPEIIKISDQLWWYYYSG